MTTMRISSSNVIEGIRKIISNACRYIQDSKILLKDGSLEHAVVSAVFAAEELAKANMLSKKLAEYEGKAFIELPECPHWIHKWMLCHRCKLEEAKRLLGNALIIESCRVGIVRFPFRLGVEDKEASHDVRLTCQFVDWNKGNREWEFGTRYNTSMLKLDLLKGIENQLRTIATKHDISGVGNLT